MSITFERTTFTINRALEFFSEKELTMQIGHPRHMWPIALVKELIDNALDACEGAAVETPEIVVTIGRDSVTVADNGPGLPLTTLQKSLDYLVRASDKALYVSPTRGQLGNALKCVWAAPFVANDTGHGRVIVAMHGHKHTIDVRLDHIAGVPDITLDTESCNVKTGTVVTMEWTGIAGYLHGETIPPFHKAPTIYSIAARYAAFNPGLSITIADNVKGQRYIWDRSATEHAHWSPNRPTSPHWYTPDQFHALLAGELSAARANGTMPTVREFVSKFAGLTGSARQKAVTDAANLTSAPLSALIAGNEIDRVCAAALLCAMRNESRPIKPAALGTIGKTHFIHHMVNNCHIEVDSIRYHKSEGEADGLPFILEMAFGVYDKAHQDQPANIVVGANWAPVLTPASFIQLKEALSNARVDADDPVVLILHIACPRIKTTDKGKGAIVL